MPSNKETNPSELPAREFLSVDDIAQRWGVSRDFVRRLFAREAGVLVFGNEAFRGSRRRYTKLLIPLAVLQRVERRHSIFGEHDSHPQTGQRSELLARMHLENANEQA